MPPPKLPGRPVKRRRKGAQMTIEDVLSRGKDIRAVSQATSSAPSSPSQMRSTPTASSPIPVSDDSDSDLPIRKARPARTVVEVDDDEDDDDDDDDVRPAKRRRQTAARNDSDSETATGADDDVRPGKRRPPAREDSDSDSDDVVITTPKNKRSRLVRNASSPVSSAAKRPGIRSARTEKQRHMELLRRRRMGHKVTESDLESELSDDGDAARVALYDKDPDHVALSDFEDDEGEEEKEEEEEEEEDEKTKQKRQKKEEKEKKRKEKKTSAKKSKRKDSPEIIQLRRTFDDAEDDDGYDYNGGQGSADDGDGAASHDDEQDDDMADFIDDTKFGVLGAPDGSDAEDEEAMLRREIPLQFTFQAHKPLKSHFKDAVEWLVHRRLHAAAGGSTADRVALADTFTKADNELYRVAWDRLDREVGGLAQSRFISSVWTAEFYSALRARPYMDSFNIRPSGGRSGGFGAAARLLLPGSDENVCHACGRTNHPASFQVTFSGKAYYSKTLDDVEGGSDNDGGSDDDNSGPVDMNGNPIAPASRRWLVGATCHSNAETAHDLLHWRRALKDWVEEKMQADRLLDDIKNKMAKRAKKDKGKDKNRSAKKEKKTKTMQKLRAFGYTVADEWEANGTINSLFRDFKKMLEAAQAKSTQTSSRFGR